MSCCTEPLVEIPITAPTAKHTRAITKASSFCPDLRNDRSSSSDPEFALTLYFYTLPELSTRPVVPFVCSLRIASARRLRPLVSRCKAGGWGHLVNHCQ
jgi:hypothetical protein